TTGLTWRALDDIWAAAGELDVFSAGWLSDHLSDVSRDRGGPAFEAFTSAAALARRVPGKSIGIAVAASTFRHPAVLAKQATMLDIVTGGRFILGVGAGWHPGEHEAFGVPLPDAPARFDRYESQLRVLKALFSADARQSPGVTLDDPHYPLDQATNEPPPLTPGGPPIWLGGQKRRSLDLIGRYASGWPMYGNRAGDLAFFTEMRGKILDALEAAGRDPQAFTFAAQVNAGTETATRREGLEQARALQKAGAHHVIVGIPGTSTADDLRAVAREVAQPLTDEATAP
ncbi:MAG TPA: LLM class flavin-dependent oxidoreductase, partial [Candidatus Limnocylindrales bacterium]|nr:LLM class flavin-dependent oxidoreductase [Candidatus Limnocylindrales bacterium]